MTTTRALTLLGLRLLPALLVTAAAAPPLVAGDLTGFLPARGQGTVAFSYTDESYDRFWRGTESVPTPGVLGEIATGSTSVWMNWGLTDRVALVVDAAHVDVGSNGTGGLSDSGLQDLSLLLARRLWERPSGRLSHSLVGALGVRAPMASYEADSPVARGDDTTDSLVRLVYLLRSGRFYWSQQLGYDLRGGDAPDGLPLYTELGWSTGRLSWIGWYSSYLAGSGTDIGEPGFTFPSNREELERLGGKAILGLGGDWAAFVGAFTTLDGRNTGDASGWSLGLIRKF